MEEQYKYDLFDRYHRGELDQSELDAFLERLNTDETFRADYEMHHLLVEGIREHERQDLKAFMQEKARVRFMGNPWSKTWTYASAAILIGFGVLYVVLDKTIPQEELSDKPNPKELVFPVDTADEKPEETLTDAEPIQKTEKEPENESQYPQSDPITPLPDSSDEDNIPEWQSAEDPSRMAGMTQGDELPVKQDVRIYDTVLSLKLQFPKDSTNLTKKGAGGKEEKIVVQFWKSPINYKGYRFDGRKLEVFGLDSIDQVEVKYYVVNAELEVVD
ncbi:MAG: hypothetical protein LPK45_11610, partial [Bacteroidota bacterium]|nr:hypothetical protein [Bacteroidota bacterium]MDX5431753.1 hypothetical protein [Bacteroidota bacterium]MDX5470468.1 hypothetical protein [Bacteroidota bacterium]